MLGVYLAGNYADLYPSTNHRESVLFKRLHAASTNPDTMDVIAGLSNPSEFCLVRDWSVLQQRPVQYLPMLEWDAAGLLVHVRDYGVAHALSVRWTPFCYQPVQVVPANPSGEFIFSLRDELGRGVSLRAACQLSNQGFMQFDGGELVRWTGLHKDQRAQMRLTNEAGRAIDVKVIVC